MTNLDRLHGKEPLLCEKEGVAWRYQPILGRMAFERSKVDALAAARFGGEPIARALVSVSC